jgi:hypothetical protein
MERFGKTVIVIDNVDWKTVQIVRASLDRWQAEDRFRQSKDEVLPALGWWVDADGALRPTLR